MITVRHRPEKDKGQSEDEATAIYAAILQNQGSHAALAKTVRGSPSVWIDKQVRLQVYAHFLTAGHAPQMEEVAQALSHSLLVVQAAYQGLAAAKAIVLQASGEVLMAEPFSAVPTAFVVEVGSRTCWGNCIWDALGIAAMLKEHARVATACGCCGEEMTLDIRDGTLLTAPGFVHFAIPARDWWRNVVFTGKTMLLFRSEEHVDRRCQQWRQPHGAILSLEQQWRLARAWYEDRLSFAWRRKTDEEVAALWTKLGFTASFWSLPR